MGGALPIFVSFRFVASARAWTEQSPPPNRSAMSSVGGDCDSDSTGYTSTSGGTPKTWYSDVSLVPDPTVDDTGEELSDTLFVHEAVYGEDHWGGITGSSSECESDPEEQEGNCNVMGVVLSLAWAPDLLGWTVIGLYPDALRDDAITDDMYPFMVIQDDMGMGSEAIIDYFRAPGFTPTRSLEPQHALGLIRRTAEQFPTHEQRQMVWDRATSVLEDELFWRIVETDGYVPLEVFLGRVRALNPIEPHEQPEVQLQHQNDEWDGDDELTEVDEGFPPSPEYHPSTPPRGSTLILDIPASALNDGAEGHVWASEYYADVYEEASAAGRAIQLVVMFSGEMP